MADFLCLLLLILVVVLVYHVVRARLALARAHFSHAWGSRWRLVSFFSSLVIPGLGQALRGHGRTGLTHFILFAATAVLLGPLCLCISVFSAVHTLLL